jgi:hypothetical protein
MSRTMAAVLGFFSILPWLFAPWLWSLPTNPPADPTSPEYRAFEARYDNFPLIVTVLGTICAIELFFYWRLVAKAKRTPGKFRGDVLFWVWLFHMAAFPVLWYRYVWKAVVQQPD